MRPSRSFFASLTFLAAASFSFSPIAFAAGPAGVESGLKFWFSADSGAKDSGGSLASDGEQVETWEDQSSDNRDAVRSAGGAAYSENGLNFNPTLDFSDDRYQASDTGLVSGSGDRSIFIVASADSGGWRYVLGAGTFGGGAGFDFGHNSNNASVFITTHSSQEASTGSWTPYGSARLAYGAVNGGPLYIAVNGSAPSVGSGGSVNTTLSGSVKIGSNSRGDEYWDGSISEVIYYDRLVTATERQRVNSYLALKYGFSLDQGTAQSYLASGSNLMWDKDAADASTYDNDLFGIGRDDASNLSQIKSKGQNATTVITVEAVDEGTNLVPDFEDIDDLEFLVFGDNGGAASWTQTGAPSGYSILERKWKKQEQGNVGFVNLDFDVANSNMNIPAPLDAGVYYFVYDSDNDGSLSDEVPQGMTDRGSDDWRVSVDFGAGGLFTLATTENPAAESLSPVDNAVGVSATENLVIVFSAAVTADTGNIVIKKSSDDSTVETIAVTSGQVTGGGTDTITINPSVTLSEGTEYYVQIPSTAFKDGSDNYFPGITNTTGWSFTTIPDSSAPTISNIATNTITSSGATITWNTNELASTKVVYSADLNYASTTAEADTAPRVTSHSQALSDLLACTIYNYRVVSRDAGNNAATSTSSTFLTTGCSGGATPSSATTTVVTVSSAATTTATDGLNTITVETPEDFTATSSSIVIQIKGLPSDTVLGSIGKPTSSLNSGASIVFDVKALIDNITELDSFDVPVTITYTYADEEVSDLDENSLSMYHYADGVWSELDDCSVNTSTNTITCTAPHFSIFAIFGNAASSGGGASSSGSSSKIRFGCKDPDASNYEQFASHTQELCRYEAASTARMCSPHIDTYIRYGAENDADDVRKLETFLNEKQGESLPVDGVYSLDDVEAVKRFQKAYASEVLDIWGLSEPTGYVYRTTLIKINSFYCTSSVACPAFTEHNSRTENPVSPEITKTKILLSELGFFTGVVNDEFDIPLYDALSSFQETFSDTMLKPWGLTAGTGYKYKTTNKFLNMIMGCQTPAVELDGRGTFDY